jgi:hypothetical protein
LPKFPFIHWQHWCHRQAQIRISKLILACIAGAGVPADWHVRGCGHVRANELFTEESTMNNGNLTAHFKVKDFSAWRISYNGNEKNRVSAGITNERVFHSPDNPNEVVILQDVSDVAKARTWLASDEMKTAWEKSGVLGLPSFRFAAAA